MAPGVSYVESASLHLKRYRVTYNMNPRDQQGEHLEKLLVGCITRTSTSYFLESRRLIPFIHIKREKRNISECVPRMKYNRTLLCYDGALVQVAPIVTIVTPLRFSSGPQKVSPA